MKNEHASCVPSDVMEEVKRKLNEVKDLLGPHMSTLTKEERKTLPKMGEKTMAFVVNAHKYSKQHPELLPAYVTEKDFDVDVTDATGLLPIKDLLQQMQDEISDTTLLAGSEAYTQALLFYKNAKFAASNNVPGAKGVYDDLSSRFPSGKRKQDVSKGIEE
ncbi:hypothetical protein [Plebeiibacterium marinum]|uniref:Uncharacterized protein n=1 Tax=Plebeiibacterium marinum TaxID=2992111 RepID=A0AAE3SLV4_9BACT|nr:hypothetical protein [Plebeiobacterium marinum]MCW3807998.1 hypothetical protein [Plebeiobacterium marinum]